MNTKYLSIGLFILFVGVGLFTTLDNEKEDIFDCDSISTIYLKPSETEYASELAKNENALIITPERKRISGNNNILECDNFDHKEIIKNLELQPLNAE